MRKVYHTRSMMKISTHGINICISYPFVALLCFSVIVSKNMITVIAVLSAIMHEIGHIAVMKKFSSEVINVNVGLFELSIHDESRPISEYNKDLAVNCAGPVVNIILWVLFYILYKFTFWSTAYSVAMVNISLGIFNLLPIETTDGGQILKIILSKKISVTTADTIMTVLSFIFIIPISIAGFYVLINSQYNYTMLFAVLYFVTALVFGLKK